MELTLVEDELRALLQLLFEKFAENSTDAVTAHHTKLLISASAYISGIMGPNLSNKVNHKSIIVDVTKLRFIQ